MNPEISADGTMISPRGRSRYPSAKSSIRALREGFVPSRPIDKRSFSPPPPTSVRDDRNPREYLPRYVDVDDDENEESGSYVQYHNDAVNTNYRSQSVGATDNQSDSDAADDNTPQGPSPWDAWLDGTDDNATTGNADDNAEVANDGGSPQGPAPWDCWLDGEEPNAVASDQTAAIQAAGNDTGSVPQKDPEDGDMGGEEQEQDIGANAPLAGNEAPRQEEIAFDNNALPASAPAIGYSHQAAFESTVFAEATPQGYCSQGFPSHCEWPLGGPTPQHTVPQLQSEAIHHFEYAYQMAPIFTTSIHEPQPYQEPQINHIAPSIQPPQPKIRASLYHKVARRFPKAIQPKTNQQGRGRRVNSPAIAGGIEKRCGSAAKRSAGVRPGPGQEIPWGPLKDTLSVSCPPRREIPPEWLVKPSPVPKKPVPWRQWGAVALLVGLAFLNV